MDLTGNISIRPGGIDDIMNFFVTEYIKGNLRDDNNSIDEYVNTLRTMIKENADDEKFTNEEKFTNDMKNLFNDVKDVKQYNPDDNDNDDFEDIKIFHLKDNRRVNPPYPQDNYEKI